MSLSQVGSQEQAGEPTTADQATDLLLRIKAIIRSEGTTRLSKIVGRTSRQLRRYSPGSDIPVNVLMALRSITGVSAAWILDGIITSENDYLWHGTFLHEKMSWLDSEIASFEPTAAEGELNRLACLIAARNATLSECDRYNAGDIAQYNTVLNGKTVGIPVYDIRLAAGTAQFYEHSRISGWMPFEGSFLLEVAGSVSGVDLCVLSVAGDSMEPLICDKGRVLIDYRDKRLRNAIFAFRLGDELRLKRLRPTPSGIEVLSENPQYEPELLTEDRLEDFDIIGRAIWSGSRLL